MAQSARIKTVIHVISGESFMSAPFFGFRFVRSPLSMARGIRLFVHALSVRAEWRFVFHNNFVEV